MKDFSFDYDLLVQKLFEKIQADTVPVTAKAFVGEILAHVKRNRSKKTYEGYELVCEKFLCYFSPDRNINTIKLKEAERFIESLKKTAPKGVYNYLRVLKAMFNKAVEWDYLKENPFEKIKLKKRQRISPAFVTEEQLEEIITSTDNVIVSDVIITAFYTGCRLGELINFTWQDVNLKDNHLTIGNASYQTKSRKQRVVPLHPKVKEILIKRFPKIIKRENHYVFCKGNGYGYSGDYFSRRFKRACRKAGMNEELHFHSLRHSFASSLVQKGVPLYSIKELLGHSSIACTEIYSHLSLASLREAISKFD